MFGTFCKRKEICGKVSKLASSAWMLASVACNCQKLEAMQLNFLKLYNITLHHITLHYPTMHLMQYITMHFYWKVPKNWPPSCALFEHVVKLLATIKCNIITVVIVVDRKHSNW